MAIAARGADVIAAFLRICDARVRRRGIVGLIVGIAIGLGSPLFCGFAMNLPIFGLAANAS